MPRYVYADRMIEHREMSLSSFQPDAQQRPTILSQVNQKEKIPCINSCQQTRTLELRVTQKALGTRQKIKIRVYQHESTSSIQFSARAPGILRNIDFRISQDFMYDLMEQHHDTVMILLSSGRLVIQWVFRERVRNAQDLFSISGCARMIKFGTTSSSSSCSKPTEYRCDTIKDLCHVLRYCL